MSPEQVIDGVKSVLSARPGTLGLALVGSRASGDPTRIDRWSDADFLVLCTEEERECLIAEDWPHEVGDVVMVFPRIMTDELRVLFDGCFMIDVHLITVAEAEELRGPCELGEHLAPGVEVLYDQRGLMAELTTRVQPPPPEPHQPHVGAAVFWFNLAYCAGLVERGDLFRAAHFTNWYLQLFLLGLLRPIETAEDTKWLTRKLPPDEYQALAACFSPLEQCAMARGLLACLDCFWMFADRLDEPLSTDQIVSFRRIEADVVPRMRSLLGG